jgi:hypothetical protein
LLALPLFFVVWWTLREPPPPEPASLAPQLVQPAVQAPATPRTAAPRAAPAPAAASSASYASDDVLPDGLRIAPANSGEAHEPGMLPHPITPQHERIFRENSLVGNLNGAMDVKDVQGLRALLQQYRDEYPEDANLLQEGYAIIADCLEHPSAETRAAAQRYYDEELASSLRRYIRRHCLEN